MEKEEKSNGYRRESYILYDNFHTNSRKKAINKLRSFVNSFPEEDSIYISVRAICKSPAVLISSLPVEPEFPVRVEESDSPVPDDDKTSYQNV